MALGRIIRIPVLGEITEIVNVDMRWRPLADATVGAGAYLERVAPYGLAPYNDDKTDHLIVLAVDEDGIAKGLRLNPRAGLLYGSQFHGDAIRGDAFIFGEKIEWDPEDGPERIFTSLPDDVTVQSVEDLIKLAALATSFEGLTRRS